jgi:c-di-GMP-binding flagellar brake protein YcgR
VKNTLWRQFISPLKALVRQSAHRFELTPETAVPSPCHASEICLETLNNWLQTRRVLSVENGFWQGQSLMLAIDAKRDLIWIDEIFPAQNTLNEGQPLQVSLRQGFERCYFTSTVIAIVDKPQGRMIALQLPSEIHRAPRRTHRRFTLPGPRFTAKVRAPGLHAESCQVINISAGGMRISLNGNLLKHYRPGVSLPFCRFVLGPDIFITCRATIKAAMLDKTAGRKTQVSLAFADIPLTQRQQIDAYLHRLEALRGERQVAVSA